MENWWVYVLFAVTCALCVLIMTKTNRKYMNYYENNMTKTADKKDDSPKDIWKKEKVFPPSEKRASESRG